MLSTTETPLSRVLLAFVSLLATAVGCKDFESNTKLLSDKEIQTALELLQSVGATVCHENHPLLPVSCDSDLSYLRDDSHRQLLSESESPSDYDWLFNLLAALCCVSLAALAAGLTLGMLGMDPIMLLIKERAGTAQEQRMASKLLPFVKQHHRLLVTLLLLNSLANEALPIFLEAVVPPTVAVLLSVTLVLFFGEIIPSAIFTGPDQLKIAYRLTPLVKTAMFLLYPIAGPIAHLLDIILHDEEEDSAYNRGELSALIRIQYEERLATKRRRKEQREMLGIVKGDHVGPLDFTPHPSNHRASLRAAKSQMEHSDSEKYGTPLVPSTHGTVAAPRRPTVRYYEQAYNEDSTDSIHVDEVTMVEGALQMKTKMAHDVFTPLRRVFAVPQDMILTEPNLVNIYASGFSRVPVYVRNEKTPKNKTAICGILITRQLIVVNPRDKREVSTLPLYRPICVSNALSLVDLLNLFQTGGRGVNRVGHMALVCARPRPGNDALAQGLPIPESAGLMGIITLEDVLESLLQEQIYDEMDRHERNANRLAKLVVKRWKNYVQRKKEGVLMQPPYEPRLFPVVQQAVATGASPAAIEEGLATEISALLQGKPAS